MIHRFAGHLRNQNEGGGGDPIVLPPATNLLAYYQGNQVELSGANAVVITDLSGNENHLTPFSGQAGPVKSGNTLQFRDGTSVMQASVSLDWTTLNVGGIFFVWRGTGQLVNKSFARFFGLRTSANNFFNMGYRDQITAFVQMQDGVAGASALQNLPYTQSENPSAFYFTLHRPQATYHCEAGDESAYGNDTTAQGRNAFATGFTSITVGNMLDATVAAPIAGQGADFDMEALAIYSAGYTNGDGQAVRDSIVSHFSNLAL